MPEFRSWRDRLEHAGGVLPARIRVSRKSSREGDKQVHSHEQQGSEMDAAWGEIDDTWWWKESWSGTTFERPGFSDILHFCESNPRPQSDPGRVEWWAPARFGRSLDKNGAPDILKFMSTYSRFEDSGWELHFLTLPRIRNSLADVINLAVHAYAAAVYSADLSKHAARGRRNEGEKGWWINGQAPWGTKRFDTRENRVLEPGENSTPGGGGTILVGDPAVIRHWNPGAEKFLLGASYKGIGQELYKKGLRGPEGGALGHRHIQNFLTNRHLIGQVKTRDTEGKVVWRKAQWGPLVDMALFEKVQAEVRRRKGEPRNKKRTSKGTFLVRPVCAHCGIEYHGGRLGAKQGSRRTYVHAKPDEALHPTIYQDHVEYGCKAWTIDADEIETSIKDLILQQRASTDYEAEVRAMLTEKERFKKGAAAAIQEAEGRIAAAVSDYKKQAQLLSDAARRGLNQEPFFEELERIQQKENAARAELETAEDYSRSRDLAWSRLERVINETRNLGETWNQVGLDERRVLLDWWVLGVLVVVEPIPGMKRANHKSAVVTLRSDPHAPKHFLVGSQPVSASESSSRTQASSSKKRRDTKSAPMSEATSGGDPSPDAILPSAQAACPRISGSSSANASESTGTASDEPQLPKATATFRSNPLRFVRLTGEPLNRCENPSCDSAINSTSLAPCTPSRGQNADSSVTVENLCECGHTSWQMSHP